MSDHYADVGRAQTPQALEEMMDRSWWVIGLRGAVALLFGLGALIFTGATMLSIVLLFAAFALVDGVFAIVGAVRAVRHHHHWAYLALQGIVSIAAAVVAVMSPKLTVVVFVLLLAAWSLISGALMVGLAIGMPGKQRWWMLLNGALSLIFGLALVVAPIMGAVVLTWWLGGFAVMYGISLIVLAFTLRAHGQETHAGTPAHA